MVIHVQGDKYIGTWLNDREHGQGTYLFAEGNKYEGEWKDGMRNGCVFVCFVSVFLCWQLPSPAIRPLVFAAS